MKSSKRKQARRGHKRGNKSSSLTRSAPETKVWNLRAQQMPEFNNTLKRDNSVHRFIQLIDGGLVFQTSTAGPTFYAKFFQLADLAQQSTFTALFDQYRIDEIELWFQPVTVGSNPPASDVNWYSVIDYDDAATPSGLGQLQQYTNVLMTTLSSGHYVRFKPHVATAVYNGTFAGFANSKAPWIDAASSSVQHYGFKAGCNTTAAPVVNFNLTMRYHISCRNLF